MRAGIIILLSLAHLGEATFDEELCDAVAKAQNTTITLKQVADSAVKDHDLSVLKVRKLFMQCDSSMSDSFFRIAP